MKRFIGGKKLSFRTSTVIKICDCSTRLKKVIRKKIYQPKRERE
jgi:hypothetical protein